MTLGTYVAFASVLYLGGATLFGYKPDWLGWLLPIAARLIEGPPLRVVAERVDMAGHSLRWLVSRIDQSRTYYLLGEVEIADGRGPALTGRLDSVESDNPATYRGRRPAPALRPRCGTGAVARPRGRARRGGGSVLAQARRDGGDAGSWEERIPEQLRRFLRNRWRAPVASETIIPE